MKDCILELNSISFAAKNENLFQSTKKDILKNISCSFERGKIYGLTGESGSGKTTLAKLIAGIHKPVTGEAIFKYKNNWNDSLTSPVQILFQNDGYLLNPNRRIIDILVEAFRIKHNSKDNFNEQINNLCLSLGINDKLLNSKGSQLSGGEQQRLAFARILIIEPELLILDEPFSSQDTEAKSLLIDFIFNINKSLQTTIICISHDIYALKEFAEEIIILSDGQIAEIAPTVKIFEEPESSYTKFLLSAQLLSLSKEEIISYIRDGKDKRN